MQEVVQQRQLNSSELFGNRPQAANYLGFNSLYPGIVSQNGGFVSQANQTSSIGDYYANRVSEAHRIFEQSSQFRGSMNALPP
jgi:hypothetical protein